PLIGAALTIPSTLVAQIIAEECSVDFVMIDMEHAPLSAEMATYLVHATTAASARTGRYCHTLIRVPSAGLEWIKWALDSGASGIIIPMINNVNDMEAVIDRALYPPKGRRSFGPTMAAFSQPAGSGGVMGYFDRARNGHTAILPMIESREGVENLEKIMAVEGVSGVFVGPFDLRLALGLPGALDGDEPTFQQALEKACAAAKHEGKIVGSMGIGVDASAKRTKEGMSFLVAVADYAVIAPGISAAISDSRA
ncbi:Phosphoenolpyruvate/pyruvate domain-containing protein, partial [Pyrenochaeta sp. DS3sAY3a]